MNQFSFSVHFFVDVNAICFSFASLYIVISKKTELNQAALVHKLIYLPDPSDKFLLMTGSREFADLRS